VRPRRDQLHQPAWSLNEKTRALRPARLPVEFTNAQSDAVAVIAIAFLLVTSSVFVIVMIECSCVVHILGKRIICDYR
jgi:hypothetical protein